MWNVQVKVSKSEATRAICRLLCTVDRDLDSQQRWQFPGLDSTVGRRPWG